MDESVISESVSPLGGCIARLWGSLLAWLSPLFFVAFMLFVFGFSIKFSDAYDCIMQAVEQDPQVIRAIGEPVTPGFFAWTTSYEGGFGYSSGHFYTAVSGLRGRGRIEAAFQSDPIYDLLISIRFKFQGEETEIYRGAYECP